MPAKPIQFYNRLKQRLEREAVYGEGPLRFVYENPLGKLALHLLVKRAIFSEIYGHRMDDLDSAAKIGPFIDKYDVDTSEFAESAESYRTFNEFFYRRLKPEARPIASDPHAAVLPADGRHFVIPDVSLCRNFFVKGVKFDLAALLDDAELAARYEKGAVLISRLCPTDYHRFHFPCGGVADTPRLIHGPLYSVSPIAFLKRPSIFWENKRYLTRLQKSHFGEVLLLEVGATCVGSVIHTSQADTALMKGDEKGYFRFGGSCFITIFEPGRIQFADDLLLHSSQGIEVYARMGDVAGFAIERGDSSLPSSPAS